MAKGMIFAMDSSRKCIFWFGENFAGKRNFY